VPAGASTDALLLLNHTELDNILRNVELDKQAKRVGMTSGRRASASR